MMAKDVIFISTSEEVAELVDWVARQDTWLGDLQPPLYIDIEGERLGRYGKISLLTVLVYPGQGLERPHIIDIHGLGRTAFSTVGRRGKSLRDILESPQFLKVFFDVRNDSDALYAHYGIKLQGVRDVQLMESACRATTDRRSFVSGLAACIEEFLHGQERNRWRLCKKNGERLWNPQKGGSYSVFNSRPLSDDIIEYCVGDVQYLPGLYHKYSRGTDRWRKLIAEESQNRVIASQKTEYQPSGEGRARSPWSLEQNKTLDFWGEVNPPNDYFGSFEDDDVDSTWDDRLDWEDDRDDNDYEDWTRAPWQGPPS